MKDYLKDVPLEAFEDFVRTNYPIRIFDKIKKCGHPTYGTYFYFSGWLTTGHNEFIQPRMFGKFSILNSYGESMVAFPDPARTSAFDDFDELINADPKEKEILMNWVKVVASYNTEEYFQAFKNNMTTYIDDAFERRLASARKLFYRDHRKAKEVLDEFKELGLCDAEDANERDV